MTRVKYALSTFYVCFFKNDFSHRLGYKIKISCYKIHKGTEQQAYGIR